MKEIIKAMPARRNWRRIMGVPTSITHRVRPRRSESSFFFVLWSQNRHLWGVGDMRREIIRPSSCQQTGSCGRLVLNRLSNNVGGVKHFLSVLLRALRRARHFALIEKQLPVPTKARS